MNFLSNLVLVALVFLEVLCLHRISAADGLPNSLPSFADPTLTPTSSDSDSNTSKVMSLATGNIPTSSSSASSLSSTGKKVGIFPNHGVSQIAENISGHTTQVVSRVFSYKTDEKPFLVKTTQKTTQTSTVINDDEYDNAFAQYADAMKEKKYDEVQPIVLSQAPVDYNSHSTLQVEQSSSSVSGTVNSVSQIVIACEKEGAIIPKLPVIVQVNKSTSGTVKQHAEVIVACERYCAQPISVTQVSNAVSGIVKQTIEFYYDCPKGVVPSLDLYQNSRRVSGEAKFKVSVFVNYK